MCHTNAFAPGGSIDWNHLDGKDEDKMKSSNLDDLLLLCQMLNVCQRFAAKLNVSRDDVRVIQTGLRYAVDMVGNAQKHEEKGR